MITLLLKQSLLIFTHFRLKTKYNIGVYGTQENHQLLAVGKRFVYLCDCPVSFRLSRDPLNFFFAPFYIAVYIFKVNIIITVFRILCTQHNYTFLTGHSGGSPPVMEVPCEEGELISC